MSKQIKGDDGKVYVQKKPVYKRIWFWVLAVIIVFSLGSALNGGSDDSNSTKPASSTKAAKSSSTKIPAQHLAALAKAKSYAKTMSMSEKGIHDQLTSEAGEGFTEPAAKYAMDHLTDIDWNENALKKAKSYQKNMSMSTNAIKDQLTSEAGEGFTPEQAQYAIDHLDK